MPKLADVPGVIRLRWIGTDAADQALGSHLTWKYTGSAPSSAQLGTVATAWGNSWATNMAPVTDTGYVLTLIEIVDLSSSTSGTTETTMSHPGTRVGTPVPLNCAFTVGYTTPLRRRGGHWHSQVRAGVQADLVDVQHWSQTFITAFTNAWNNWLVGMQGTLWSGASAISLVAVQYFGPPNRTVTSSTGRVKTVSTPLPVPNVFPVTANTFRSRIGSQRRRLG